MGPWAALDPGRSSGRWRLFGLGHLPDGQDGLVVHRHVPDHLLRGGYVSRPERDEKPVRVQFTKAFIEGGGPEAPDFPTYVRFLGTMSGLPSHQTGSLVKHLRLVE